MEVAKIISNIFSLMKKYTMIHIHVPRNKGAAVESPSDFLIHIVHFFLAFYPITHILMFSQLGNNRLESLSYSGKLQKMRMVQLIEQGEFR